MGLVGKVKKLHVGRRKGKDEERSETPNSENRIDELSSTADLDETLPLTAQEARNKQRLEYFKNQDGERDSGDQRRLEYPRSESSHASPSGNIAQSRNLLEYLDADSPTDQPSELSADASQSKTIVYRITNEDHALSDATDRVIDRKPVTRSATDPAFHKSLPDTPESLQLGGSEDLAIQHPDSPTSSAVLKKRPHSSSHFAIFDSEGTLKDKLKKAIADLQKAEANSKSKDKRIAELEKIHAETMSSERARHRGEQEVSRKEMERIKSDHKDELERQQRYHERELKEKDRQHKQDFNDQREIDWQDYKAKLREKTREKDQRISDLEQDLRDLGSQTVYDKQQMIDNHDEEIRKFQAANQKLAYDSEQREAAHHNEMVEWAKEEKAKMSARHAEKIRLMNVDFNEILTKHTQQMEDMKAQQAQERSNFKARMEEEAEGHAEELAGLKQEQAEELSALRAEMDALKKDHANQIEELKKAHAEEKQLLQQTHQQQTKSIRAHNRELNDLLLTSDAEAGIGSIFKANLPKFPDGQIRDQFLTVQQLVVQLGNIKPRPDRKMWTDEMIEKVDSGSRSKLIMESITQSMIWSLLYRMVFCSPFRMFGDEGRKLEHEWNQECGKDPSSTDKIYIWPAPGTRAERWRYMTMKECRELLSGPQPSQIDARARVVSGFQNSLRRLVLELRNMLAEVVEVGAPQVQVIQRLSTEVSKLWLEFCMHRCRVRVLLKGPIEAPTPDSIAESPTGRWELTVTPEVGRHGNFQGFELEIFTTVSGCAGESLVIP